MGSKQLKLESSITKQLSSQKILGKYKTKSRKNNRLSVFKSLEPRIITQSKFPERVKQKSYESSKQTLISWNPTTAS